MGAKKLIYKKTILKQLYFNPGISCTELAHRINKSIPLTTRILEELVLENLVKDLGPGTAGLGRKPRTYALLDNSFFMLAVAADQFLTRIVLVSNQNKKVWEAQLEMALDSNQEQLTVFCQSVDELITDSGVDRSRILGLGLGVSGSIDFNKGMNSLFQEKTETGIQFLSKRLQVPAFIDNGSRLIALAEFQFGKAVKHPNTMVLNLSWDIGLGMILTGEVFRGQDGFAGEFSHLPIFNNNKLCHCGKTGCLETETSMLVLIDKISEGVRSGRKSVLNREIDSVSREKAFDLVVHAALKGDQFVIELISELGYNIGQGVAILIHLLNPGQIVLSGRGASLGKLWVTSIQHAINKHCIPAIAENVEFEVSQMGADAEFIGAAALVMENIDTTAFDLYPVKTTKPLPIPI